MRVTLAAARTPGSAPPNADCCRHEELAQEYGVIWTGMSQTMTIERLAAYAAPRAVVLPRRAALEAAPQAGSARGREILIPEPFSFEADLGGPIIYYRVRRILQRIDEPGAGSYVVSPELRGQSQVDLAKIVGIDLDFFFYYSKDFGGGTHVHDVESVETRIAVARSPGCQDCPWVLGLVRATGKAHGIQWYDNTLTVDGSTILPVHILVEEGKHASCTDRNADGYYTPGFDVTERSQRRLGRTRHARERNLLHGPLPVLDDEGEERGDACVASAARGQSTAREPQSRRASTLWTTPSTSFDRIRAGTCGARPQALHRGQGRPELAAARGHRPRAVREVARGRILRQVVGALASGGRRSRLVTRLSAADRQERAGSAAEAGSSTAST